MMNRSQKYVLYGAAAVVVAIALFPPWRLHLKGYDSVKGGLGTKYGFLFAPPATWDESAEVNVGMLASEIAASLVATCLLYLALRDGKRPVSHRAERERTEPP
jgi:hypothetical protein